MTQTVTAERTILRHLIEEKGVRFTFLAEKIGITPSHFTRMLNRERTITVVAVDTLAQVLGVSKTVFFDGRDLLICRNSAVSQNVTEAPPSSSLDGDVSNRQDSARAE